MTHKVLHKVFVYGSLKKGFSNNSVLDGGFFINKDKTLDNWYMFSMGAFPAVTRGYSYIKGELWEVDDDGLARLDRLEGNGHFYTREEIMLDSGEVAWMYVVGPDGYDISNDKNIMFENGVQDWALPEY